MKTFQVNELMPIVAQIIGRPEADSLKWEQCSLKVQGGQTAGVLGLVRLVGTAQVAGQTMPWSMIVKIIRKPDLATDPTGTVNHPAAWNYWQREVFAYQSELLTDLAESLVAPRCYGVTEHADGEWHIWLEEITESPTTWTMDRHGSAARHLGHFNGAYLTGRPLPTEQPWTYRGRSRDWITVAKTMVEPFRRYAETAQGRRWLSAQSVTRIERMLANAPLLHAQLARLPLCLCHHDAHRRNLMARDKHSNEAQTVALDWSYLGYGEVGADIAALTAVDLLWMDVAGERARELDGVIFDSYLARLRDVGWQGDPRLARFGYTACAALAFGVAGAIVFGTLVWPDEESAQGLVTIIGHSRDAILDQQAIVQPFLLDLGEEALQLMERLK